MAEPKKFKLPGDKILDLASGYGACIATDKIMVEGESVDFMYREESDIDVDSGWRFFSGTEDQDYIDNPDNSAFYDINTVANYDRAIIPYLDLPIGTELERVKGTDKFQILPG